jgi:O-antigen/teichoic acid export membrane protein
VVARLLGTTALGFYDAAYKIAMVPITEIGDIIFKVSFPVYAKMGEDKEKIKKAFKETVITVTCLTVPLGIIFFFFPEFIIQLVLGPKALPAVPVLRILAAFGVIRAIAGTTSALFYTFEKQKYVSIITMVSFIVLVISIVPLVNRFGLIGAGYSALIASIASVPVALYYLQKVFKEL